MNEFIKTFDNLYHAFQDFENKLNHLCEVNFQSDAIVELHKQNVRIQNVIMYARKILGTKIDEQTAKEVSSIFSKLLREYKETTERYRSARKIAEDAGVSTSVVNEIVDTFIESINRAGQLLIDKNLKSPVKIFVSTED